MTQYGPHGEKFELDGIEPRLADAIIRNWTAFSRLYPSAIDSIREFDVVDMPVSQAAAVVNCDTVLGWEINNNPELQDMISEVPQEAVDAYATALVLRYGVALRLFEIQNNGGLPLFLDYLAESLDHAGLDLYLLVDGGVPKDISPTEEPEYFAAVNALLKEFGDSTDLGEDLIDLMSAATQRHHGGGTGPLTEGMQSNLDKLQGHLIHRLFLDENSSDEVPQPKPRNLLAAALHHRETNPDGECPTAADLLGISTDDISVATWAAAEEANARMTAARNRPPMSDENAKRILNYNRWHKDIIDRKIAGHWSVVGEPPKRPIQGSYFGTLSEQAEDLQPPDIWWANQQHALQPTSGLNIQRADRIDGKHGEMFYMSDIEPRFAAVFIGAMEDFADAHPALHDSVRKIISTPFKTADPIELQALNDSVIPVVAINNSVEFQEFLAGLPDHTVEQFAKAMAIRAATEARLSDYQMNDTDGWLNDSIATRLGVSSSQLILATNVNHQDPQMRDPAVQKLRKSLMAEFGQYERPDVSWSAFVASAIQRSHAGGDGQVTKAVVAAFEEMSAIRADWYAARDDSGTLFSDPALSIALTLAARDRQVPADLKYQLTAANVDVGRMDDAQGLLEKWWKTIPPRDEQDRINRELTFDRYGYASAMDAFARWETQSGLQPSVYQVQLPEHRARPTPARYGRLTPSETLRADPTARKHQEQRQKAAPQLNPPSARDKILPQRETRSSHHNSDDLSTKRRPALPGRSPEGLRESTSPPAREDSANDNPAPRRALPNAPVKPSVPTNPPAAPPPPHLQIKPPDGGSPPPAPGPAGR